MVEVGGGSFSYYLCGKSLLSVINRMVDYQATTVYILCHSKVKCELRSKRNGASVVPSAREQVQCRVHCCNSRYSECRLLNVGLRKIKKTFLFFILEFNLELELGLKLE